MNGHDDGDEHHQYNNNHHNNSKGQTTKRIIEEHVGFSSLPEQVHRKSLKRGFEFTLLVVGETGLGKSTLVNSLFLTDLYADRVQDSVADRMKKTVTITTQTVELEEKGVRLKLTIVDTPGFGDQINTNDCCKPIMDYIDAQFENFYKHETGYGIERKKIQDTRIHCCLYFIPPYVRGLRPIDIEAMKRLQSRVNVVPIIAKADSLTKKELELLKRSILNDIEKFEIKTYEFPICDSDDDENFKKADEEIRNAMPFAIIGSNTVIESGSKRVRGRVYPWGLVDIESPESCDFTKLRTFLCSSHMQDLKDVTHDLHYENFRIEYIRSQKHLEHLNSLSSNSSETTQPQQQQQPPVAATRSSKQNQQQSTDESLQHKDMEIKKMQDLIAKMKVTNGTSQPLNTFGHQQLPQQQQQQHYHHHHNHHYHPHQQQQQVAYANRPSQSGHSNGNNYNDGNRHTYSNYVNNAIITNSTSI